MEYAVQLIHACSMSFVGFIASASEAIIRLSGFQGFCPLALLPPCHLALCHLEKGGYKRGKVENNYRVKHHGTI